LQKRAKEFESKVNVSFKHDKRYHQLAERQSEIEEKLDLTMNGNKFLLPFLPRPEELINIGAN
jgi:hypothetical protein